MSGDSPFARAPLADAVGLDGEGEGVDEMLQDTFDTNKAGMNGATASSEMLSFLKALQIPISDKVGAPVPTMKTEMTVEDSRNIFSKTKELTASSPSGIHYGHCIAAYEIPKLAAVNTIFMVIPFKAGKPLTRWTNSLHCMRQKLKLAYVTKIRIVQMYEADFNTMFKFLLGFILMKHSEYHGINEHQLYCSRKGKCPYDALITLRVIYDMSRLQRDYISSGFNDLKGAYDRVRPNLKTITTMRIGLTKVEALCHAKALRKMRHFLRTGFGFSLEFLLWSLFNNPVGLGQGNGGGPTSFHSLMVSLEKAYESETGHWVDYTNPDPSRQFFQWLIGYVDDNTILLKLENLGYQDTASHMIKVAKQCLGIWQRLVHATGGELELTKSCFSLMTWKKKGEQRS